MILNIDDYRSAAKRRLPKSVFDIIDGGAADEQTMRRNRAAFSQIALRPHALGGAVERDISTTVFGERVSLPVLLAPAGFARMAHRSAELAVARAASAAGTVYGVSTVTSVALEDIARAAPGPKWYQLYPPADREACVSLIDRAKGAGYSALCVTIDGAVGGNRERDRRNRVSVPLKISPAMVAQGALRPRWALDFLRGGVGRGSQGLTFAAPAGSTHAGTIAQAGLALAATARPVAMNEIAAIREHWQGPLVIKGIGRADECEQLLDLGVDGFVVSNHGGRQLDGTLSSIEVLPEVVAAARGRAEVYVDSGFRRGTDVVKALALGARAVLIGRPYFFGLAVAGEQGVAAVLEVFRREIDNAMALMGCSTVSALEPKDVALLPGFAGAHPPPSEQLGGP